MSKPQTIKGFQEDRTLDLADLILAKTGESVGVIRIEAVLKTYGVVSDYTYWRKLPSVLDALGFDYDEIVEVAP